MTIEAGEDPALRLKRLNEKISSRANETKAKAAFSSVTNLTASNFRSKKTVRASGSSGSRHSSNASDDGRDDSYKGESPVPSINMRSSFSPSRRQAEANAAGSNLLGKPNRTSPLIPPRASSRPRANSRTRANSRPRPTVNVRDRLSLDTSSGPNHSQVVPASVAPMETIPAPDSNDVDHEDEFDLKHNDDAFESVATMVCDQVLPKVSNGENFYSLDTVDMNYMDEAVPESVRPVFVNALRFRAQRLPPIMTEGEPGLLLLTRECVRLGLARVDEENFLLGGGTRVGDGSTQMKNIPMPITRKENGQTQRRPLNIRSDFSVGEEVPSGRARRVRGYAPLVPRSSDDASVALSLAQSTMNKTHMMSPRQRRMAAEQEQQEREGRLRRKEEQIAEEVLKVHELQRQMAEQAMEYQKAQMEAMRKEPSPTVPDDMSWLANSGLPPQQLQLVIQAMEKNGPTAKKREHKGFAEVVKDKPVENMDIPAGMEWLKTSGLSPEEMRVAIVAMNAKNGQGTFLGEVNASASSMHDCNPVLSGSRDIPSDLGTSLDPSVPSMKLSSSFQDIKIKQTVSGGNFIDVVAPADLPEGYTFEAQGANYQAFKVTVPKGGVTGGQLFKVRAVHATQTVEVPEFAWRDPLWNVFAHGIFHPFLLLSFTFPLLALGQVQTRLQLNWLGNPASRIQVNNNFNNIGSLLGTYYLMNAMIVTSMIVHWGRGIVTDVDIGLFLGVNLLMFSFSVFITGNTRTYIRQKYKIDGDSESGDYFVSGIAMRFAIAQMGRHTAEYRTSHGFCCTASGLAQGTELSEPGSVISDGSYVPFSEIV